MRAGMRSFLLFALVCSAVVVPSRLAGQDRIFAADSSASLESPREYRPMLLSNNAGFQFGDGTWSWSGATALSGIGRIGPRAVIPVCFAGANQTDL